MSEVFIRTVGEYECALSEARAPDLRGELAAVLREPPRRIDRFIELALLGAGRCLQQASAPANTAVYLASTRGDLHATLDVLSPLVREGQLPRPNTFINTVSNAACFHLAGCFALQGRSFFISGRALAFERALQAAVTDLRAGAVTAALVGAVDAPAPPFEEHRKRFGLDVHTTLTESSRWLLLSTAPDGAAPHIDVHHFTDRTALRVWLDQTARDRTLLYTNDSALLQDRPAFSPEVSRDGRSGDEFASARAVCEFWRRKDRESTLFFVSSDAFGRYGAIVVGGS